MPSLVTTYQLKFTANAAALQVSLKALQKDSKQLGRDLKQLSADSKEAFSGFGVGQLAQIAAGGKFIQTTVQAYGQLINQQQTAVQVFGEGFKQVSDFAKQAAEDVGLSERAATQLTTKVAALAKAAGLGSDEIADFSINIVRLGADLAAAFNTSTERAVDAIVSGISGSSIEPLREYGIVINDIIIKNELLALTGEKVTGTLTQQQRTLGITSILYKRSADYIGQFDREADGLLGTQQRLQASWEDSAAALGETLAPAAQQFLNTAVSLVRTVADLNDKTHGFIGAAAGAIAFRVALNPLISPLNKVSKSAIDAGGSMAALGSAMKISIVALDTWIALQALNSAYLAEVNKQQVTLNDELQQFITLKPGMSSTAQAYDDLMGQLAKTEALKESGNIFKATGGFIRDFAENLVPLHDETRNVVEDMHNLSNSEVIDFFQELADTAPETAAAMIELAKTDPVIAAKMKESGVTIEYLQLVLERALIGRAKMAKADQAGKDAVAALTDALGLNVDQTEDATKVQYDFNKSLQEAQPEIARYFEGLDKIKLGITDAATAAREALPGAFAEAFGADTGEDTLARMRQLRDIIFQLPDGMKSIPTVAETLDPENEMGGAFLGMLQQLQDLIGPQLQTALEQGGAPAMLAAGESLGQQLQAALIERGFSEVQAADILDRVGLGPGDLKTTLEIALKVSAEDEARTLLDILRGENKVSLGDFLTLRAGIEADPEKSLNAIQGLLYLQPELKLNAALTDDVDTAAAIATLESLNLPVPTYMKVDAKKEADKIEAKLDGEKITTKVTPVVSADTFERQMANLTKPRTITIGINTVGGRSTADAAERAAQAAGTSAGVTNVRTYITIPSADPSAMTRAATRWARLNGQPTPQITRGR